MIKWSIQYNYWVSGGGEDGLFFHLLAFPLPFGFGDEPRLRWRTGERFGERLIIIELPFSFSGDGDDPPPVAEFLRDGVNRIVASKCLNLKWPKYGARERKRQREKSKKKDKMNDKSRSFHCKFNIYRMGTLLFGPSSELANKNASGQLIQDADAGALKTHE